MDLFYSDVTLLNISIMLSEEDDKYHNMESQTNSTVDSPVLQSNGLTIEDLVERGFTEERFRIDRKKLEDMLRGQTNMFTCSNGTAEDFFLKVMGDTETHISWPSKLKIGAKSKKDPHVKIIGKPEHVQLAKQMILQVLDTKKNRVTLKMDVSHSDHSYIIGKGGFKIQQVMEETGCHIHFPDSNRNSSAEKSNQVSIAGEADGVELARSKIRDLLPLVYMFELPGGFSANPGDENGPVLQHIQQTYSFNVSFKALSSGRVLIVVRGCHRLLQRLRQGLILLMEYLTGSKTVPIIGIMKTEIAFQNHSFVMGVNNLNVQMIMNKTGATITFPDPSTPSSYALTVGSSAPLQLLDASAQMGAFGTDVPPGPQVLLTKTSVLLQGSFDSVCAAWDELLKSLPLLLMFDLKEGQDVDSILINRLMERYNINIIVRPKVRENLKSVTIRGAEKDAKVLFESRREILGTYEQVNGHPEEVNGFPSSNSVPFVGIPQQSFQLPYDIPDASAMETLNVVTKLIQHNPGLVGLLSNLSLMSQHGGSAQDLVGIAQFNNLSAPGYPNNLYKNHQNPQQQQGVPKMNHNDPLLSNGYFSQALNQELPPFFLPPNLNFKSSSPTADSDSGFYGCSTASSSTSSSLCNEPHDIDGTSRRFSYGSLNNDEKRPASEYSLMSDYETKKLIANKAMYQDIEEEVRTPKNTWSGLGFSKSVPDFIMRNKTINMQRRLCSKTGMQKKPSLLTCQEEPSMASDTSPNFLSPVVGNSAGITCEAPSPFSLSNHWEAVSPVSSNFNSIRSLPQLLSFFDLQQYIDLFNQQEIDMEAFLSLTDCDLQQLNISYAGRKRMLQLISGMKQCSVKDISLRSFKAAPGAERKLSARSSEAI